MNQHEIKTKRTRKSSKFRLSAKKLFLTYSQVPVDVPKERLLQELQGKVSFAHFVIGRELHQDGGAHFHAVLISDKKFNICNANMLDVELNGTQFHGNYGTTRHVNSSIEYACKDGDYITDLDYVKDGKVISLELLLTQKFKLIGRDPTLQEYFLENTKKAFGKTDLVSVDKLFNLLGQIKSRQPKPIKANYKIEDFNVSDRLSDWITAKEKRSLFLVGPSGVGKTEFVRALAERLDWKMLTVNHLEGLNRLSPDYNAVFFDDFTFSKIDEEQLLALVDTEYQKDIRILFKVISKDPGLAQIFALNPSTLSKIKNSLVQEQFLRRIALVNVPRDFMNVQVNIQINNLNVNLNSVPGSPNQNEMSEAHLTVNDMSEAHLAPPTRAELDQACIQANLEELEHVDYAAPGR